MSKYRKKPVVVEAARYNGEITDELLLILGPSNLGSATHWHAMHGSLIINTLEGQMQAQPGDWIIKGVAGEIYPCKDDIFRKTYEHA